MHPGMRLAGTVVLVGFCVVLLSLHNCMQQTELQYHRMQLRDHRVRIEALERAQLRK